METGEHTHRLKAFAAAHLAPLLLLVLRLKVGSVFVMSGWLKLGYVINHQFDSLYTMFEDYKVPLLPVHLAAWMDMCGELGFGLMLLLGLGARLGALGLVFITAVIFHTDGNPLAVYWALICLVVAVFGPGKWSVCSIWAKKHSS